MKLILVFVPSLLLVALSAIPHQVASLPMPTPQLGLFPLGLPIQDRGDSYVIDVPVPATLVAGGVVPALPLVESLLLASPAAAAAALPPNLLLTLISAGLTPQVLV